MTQTILPGGVWPVMLTPFRDDRSIDWGGLDQLTEWYLQHGVAGLFADAQSAEVYQLSDQEKLDIAGAIVERVDGRVPVIAGGFTTGTLQQQAEFFRRMAGTGVAAVVLTTSQLSPMPQPEADWLRTTDHLLELTAEIPLGIYEMPTPYHQLLSPAAMRWAAATGRFVFHKDTCCDARMLARKIEAVSGSILRFFNADTPTLLESLRAGADGFSGIGANFVPELYVWLCEHYQREPERAERVHAALTAANPAVHRSYPAVAKEFLALRGLDISPVCRGENGAVAARDRQWLAEFLESSQRLSRSLLGQSRVVA